jgi:hypothetical protein
MASVKSKWFSIKIEGSDDTEHGFSYWQYDAFQYLQSIGFDMAYIEHIATDGHKKHIHALLHFDTARTAKGVSSYFGDGYFVETEDGKKRCLWGSELESFKINAPDKILREPIFNHVEVCHSPDSYASYMTHTSYASRLDGKEQYSIDDIKISGDTSLFWTFFLPIQEKKGALLKDVISYYQQYKTDKSVLAVLLFEGRFDLVEYVRKNSYFVHTFLSEKGGD